MTSQGLITSFSADKSIENFSATARHPGLQYLESVEVGSNAYRAGLRGGDFILKVSYLKSVGQIALANHQC